MPTGVSVPLATFTLFTGQTGRLRARWRRCPRWSRGAARGPDQRPIRDLGVNLLVAGLVDNEEPTGFYAEARQLVRSDVEPPA